MRSLRLRLLLSYVVILLLTLAVTGVALFVLLQSRPVPNAAVVNSLAIQLNSVLSTVDTESGIPTDGPTRLQRTQLNTFASRQNIRILIRRADGTITFDSTGVLRPERLRIGEVVNFMDSPYTPNLGVPSVEPLVRGTFVSPRGGDWLYVGQAVDPNADTGRQYLVFASTSLRITPDQIWQFYGPDVFLPLVQAGLIGLIIAFILSVLISRSVVKPLRDVAETADAIAAGQRERKAPVRGPTEVQTLAIAFNEMVEEVESSQQAQRDFLANVSHDLRTPLTSIQGFSQAIIDGVVAKPEAAQKAARIIHEEAGRMYRMVEELLDLARIEAGKMTMTRHGVRIGELVTAVGEKLVMVARDKGVSLRTDVTPGMPLIAGDGDRLSQVLTNIVDNALKHTPVGGIITMRCLLQDNGVLITVHDTGEGIPEADLPRIFERFYQVDKSRQRRDGAGLGLQICYQIIQAHNGKIWVESEEGQWTQFSIWLPLPPPDSSTILKRRADLVK